MSTLLNVLLQLLSLLILLVLPFKVERVTRRQPVVTYSLIGANIVIFVLTLVVSNLNLATDRQEGQASIESLMKTDELASQASTVGDWSAKENQQFEAYKQVKALQLASQTLNTPEGYKRYWQIEHAHDSIVLEPHYSVLNILAYHPGDPSAFKKLLSMFSAMFLHSNIEHIFGNMLFLWVFGGAIENFLGRRFYLSTYFSSGVAATLMHHIATIAFSPTSSMMPSLGASGAIAGVLGLFAVRFYRTKVRIFYVLLTGLLFFFVAFFIAFFPLNSILQDRRAASFLAVCIALGGLFAIGRTWAWGMFRAPSVYVIGVWVVIYNLLPALLEIAGADKGGVAYWAHIGGFICGAAYAALVGGVDEGKSEYAIEDAQTALHNSSSDDALNRASTILQKEGNKPEAHEVAAQAYDRRNSPVLAMQHYEQAIEGYFKNGDRDAAARLYGIAVGSHPQLPLRPALLLSLSSHLGQNAMWNESAALLTRLVEEFSDFPEAEIALLRAAQLWLRQYNDPAEALRMLGMFRGLYPNSQWETQIRTVETAAREALARQGG